MLTWLLKVIFDSWKEGGTVCFKSNLNHLSGKKKLLMLQLWQWTWRKYCCFCRNLYSCLPVTLKRLRDLHIKTVWINQASLYLHVSVIRPCGRNRFRVLTVVEELAAKPPEEPHWLIVARRLKVNTFRSAQIRHSRRWTVGSVQSPSTWQDKVSEDAVKRWWQLQLLWTANWSSWVNRQTLTCNGASWGRCTLTVSERCIFNVIGKTPTTSTSI